MPIGGGAIATGSDIVTVTSPLGNYTYYAEATTCANSATRTAITVSVISCTGINSNNQLSETIAIYPNPSNGTFQIKLPINAKLVITDILGKIICEQELQIGVNSVNINSFQNGIYFLKIESEGIIKTMRLIKN